MEGTTTAPVDVPTSTTAPATELSGVMIVNIIGGGVLTFIMLFIFAKRQITRFTLRSRRGPHVPVGHDSKKVILIYNYRNYKLNIFSYFAVHKKRN